MTVSASQSQTPAPPYAPARVEVLSGEPPDKSAALLAYFERKLRLVESEAAEIRRLLAVLRQG